MFWLKQGGFFMFPLLICSIVMSAVIMDRIIAYQKIMKTPLINHGDPEKKVLDLRCRMMTLYTIVVISPMLGLLGTVTGLMKSFHVLGQTANISNPQAMSLGISEALITTAAGLLIAVISTIFYNYFSSRLETYVAQYNLTGGDETK